MNEAAVACILLFILIVWQGKRITDLKKYVKSVDDDLGRAFKLLNHHASQMEKLKHGETIFQRMYGHDNKSNADLMRAFLQDYDDLMQKEDES